MMVHKRSKKKSAEYIIVGKMWFDKTYGNTYHNTTVLNAKTGKVVAQSGMTYGYGEQWKQTGYDMLIKKGLMKKKDRFNHDLKRQKFVFVNSGFGLQRDIKKKKV